MKRRGSNLKNEGRNAIKWNRFIAGKENPDQVKRERKPINDMKKTEKERGCKVTLLAKHGKEETIMKV